MRRALLLQGFDFNGNIFKCKYFFGLFTTHSFTNSNPRDIGLATVQSDLFDLYKSRLSSDIRNPSPDLCSMTDHKVLYFMGQASKEIGKFDDSVNYFKERVKSCVKAYSKGDKKHS